MGKNVLGVICGIVLLLLWLEKVDADGRCEVYGFLLANGLFPVGKADPSSGRYVKVYRDGKGRILQAEVFSPSLKKRGRRLVVDYCYVGDELRGMVEFSEEGGRVRLVKMCEVVGGWRGDSRYWRRVYTYFPVRDASALFSGRVMRCDYMVAYEYELTDGGMVVKKEFYDEGIRLGEVTWMRVAWEGEILREERWEVGKDGEKKNRIIMELRGENEVAWKVEDWRGRVTGKGRGKGMVGYFFEMEHVLPLFLERARGEVGKKIEEQIRKGFGFKKMKVVRGRKTIEMVLPPEFWTRVKKRLGDVFGKKDGCESDRGGR